MIAYRNDFFHVYYKNRVEAPCHATDISIGLFYVYFAIFEAQKKGQVEPALIVLSLITQRI